MKQVLQNANAALKGLEFYKALYYLYNFLKVDVLKPTSFVSPIITVINFLIIYKFTDNIPLTALLSVIAFGGLWLLAWFLWLVIQLIIKNHGADNKLIFSKRFLKSDEPGEPCEICMEEVNKIEARRFSFVRDTDIHLVTTLNLKAYKNSPWFTTFDNKYQRNWSHVVKNKYSMMFVNSLYDEKKLGYTHVLPVTKSAWDRYLDRKISDNNLMEKFVVADGSFSKGRNEPFGLIIFSVAFVNYDTELKEAENFYGKLTSILEDAVVYHISVHLKTLFKNRETVEILLQTMNRNCFRLFKDVAKSSNRLSKDWARIIVFEIVNPYYEES